jgi:hypothetical protein
MTRRLLLSALTALALACGSSSPMSPNAIDVAGTWTGNRTFEYKVTYTSPPVVVDCHYTEGDTLVLNQTGGSLSGSLTMNWHLVSGPTNPVGQQPGCATDNVCPGSISGEINGSSVRLLFPKQSCYQGDIAWVGTVNGGTMSGTTQPSPLVANEGSFTVVEIFQPWSVTR